MKLTDREREIASLRCQGLNNREIAERLSISYFTVKLHAQHAREKLGMKGFDRPLLAPWGLQ